MGTRRTGGEGGGAPDRRTATDETGSETGREMNGDHEHTTDGHGATPGPDPNAPLPVLSREAALSWARDFTRMMAEQAGAALRPETATEHFHDCVGRADEVADDGRFQLLYYVRGRLPQDAHLAAVGRLGKALLANGYRVTGWLGDPEREGAQRVVLDMTHPRQRTHVSAESTGDDELTFTVRTGCLLPPGARQQRF